MKLPERPALDPELDARLVQRCLDGDARAWEALVRRYQRLVYAVARSYRLGDEDVGDVFQEVFSALVRGLPRLRDARALCRWLASTTERIAFATALRRRRENALRGGDEGTLETVAAEGPELGAPLEALEGQMRVRLALGAISERCRSLLDLLYYRDPAPDYREVSERLRMPVGSIGPTRARCLERLKDALDALESEPGGITGPPGRTSARGRRKAPEGREAGS